MLLAYSSGLVLAEPRGVNPALARWHLIIKENPASCPPRVRRSRGVEAL